MHNKRQLRTKQDTNNLGPMIKTKPTREKTNHTILLLEINC